MSGGIWDDLRKPVDDVTKRASQNAKHLGQDWNIGYLEDEGAKNEKNPGRAYGKAAASVASWYLGGLLGAGGAGAGAGADAAGQTATVAAEEAAKKAAEEAAAQGLLSQAPQGFANTMEAGLTDTGYTPSSLMNAFKYGSGSNQSMEQTLGNYATNKAANVGANLKSGDFAKRYAAKQAVGLLSPQQQQPMPQPSPMRPQQQQQPMMLPYGMSEEEKQRLRMMGYPV